MNNLDPMNDRTTQTHKTQKFGQLGLDQSIVDALASSQITQPTPIQEKTIPTMLSGKDLLAQAKTGSGKTLAFALPIIQRLSKEKKAKALVLAPTRELAQQVVQVFSDFGRSIGLRVACVVGRESYSRQIEALKGGARVIVATPGRLIDLMESGRSGDFAPQIVVLDEADEMLNMGFIEDIKKIFAMTPEKRQTVFFSATFPQPIVRIAKAEQNNPEFVRLDQERKDASSNILQHFYIVSEKERRAALLRLMHDENPEKAIIFCRTKSETEHLHSFLVHKKMQAKVLHGDLTQHERNRTLQEFRSKSAGILIATDIASRGLDVDDLSHVFNYNLPENEDRYTHRIGRTGRAGRSGKSFTLTTTAEWSNHNFLRRMREKKVKISELPQKNDVEKKSSHRLLEKIHSVSVPPKVVETCNEISVNHDQFDLFCKLYTMISQDHQISGPEGIGLSKEGIDSFFSQIKSQKQRRGGARRFGHGGGGRAYGKGSFSDRKTRRFPREKRAGKRR